MAEVELALCVDVGSTFTKALLVELGTGAVLAGAEHRTTVETDVLDGYAACLASIVAREPRAGDPARTETLACSSAGGGLRIAVVGNEELVTAEAGRRVALSSGGRVVAVHAAGDALAGAGASGGTSAGPGHEDGRLAGVLARSRPDVVLLTGGTDGGNREVVVGAARDLAAGAWRGPVVAAGNAEAGEEVAGVLDDAGIPHVLAANVVPRIGVLAPDSARAAIREMFLAHVIGGKRLSRGPAFAAMVRGATPDVVLTGVEVLAAAVGDVVVVDVGGATTDVHSVVEPDPTAAGTGDSLAREVVAVAAVSRTVEGDLGMRWSAPSTVARAAEAGLLGPAAPETALETAALQTAAARRRDLPGLLPSSDAEHDVDEVIARAAVGLAVRRHAGRARVVLGPDGRVVERSGTDLREVGLVVGSGGVLRHGRAGVATRVLDAALAAQGDWQLPTRATVVVDVDYVLAAVGLLAAGHPACATALAARLAAPGRVTGGRRTL